MRYVVDSGHHEMIYLADFEKGEFELVKNSNDLLLDSNIKRFKHIYRRSNQYDTAICTVVAYDKENRLYGLVISSEKRNVGKRVLIVTWLTENDTERYINNTTDSLTEVLEIGINDLENIVNANVKKNRVISIRYAEIQGLDRIHGIEKGTLIALSRSNSMDTLQNLVHELRNESENINKLRKELEKQRNELDNKEKEIEHLISALKSNSSELKIKESYSFINNEAENTTDDILSEAVLKYVSKGDIITIPYEYFNKLKVIFNCILESNKEQTVYKALAEVKFDSKSQGNIFVLIDYNEEKVIFEIIKKYNKNKIDDSEIAEYKINYVKHRRERLTV